ncbi:hypothetical protein P255_00735 [Acinetobacter brisouii CIP 110357]|uniref:DUF4062 domain-containing protein n=1 Tax=Acinetobacter brisouii CIP 110357 TaxID=1341683 RepID=V2VXU5_9GAMM|nr:DUF4062 domain-containing protein [Acinetobacter brisouii]ENV46591.1 hypothetical protein F954_02575 [Acinetobacter brisouii ANC 4119]ESK52579.1 hypothetical protein P255_00735 [Acinetobacter brisouii CIP 110357]
MAHQAIILNVMIASPSDVAEERQLVRDAIYEWNAIHSKQFGIMLNPVGWETHVAPEMGDRPQEIINKRILENSDILIGIFWTRLGTPTGDYVSGTVEEISKHITSKKLTCLYICDRPIPPSQITDQYSKLQTQINEWKPSGVLNFYRELAGFKENIKNHLTLHIRDNEYIQEIINNLNSSNSVSPIPSNQTIQPSEEMIQILLNAGESESDIQFLENIDTTNLYAGDLQLNLNGQREISTWKSAIKNLEKLGLIEDDYEGKLFKLTQNGWEAFDQLQTQLEENK